MYKKLSLFVLLLSLLSHNAIAERMNFGGVNVLIGIGGSAAKSDQTFSGISAGNSFQVGSSSAKGFSEATGTSRAIPSFAIGIGGQANNGIYIGTEFMATLFQHNFSMNSSTLSSEGKLTDAYDFRAIFGYVLDVSQMVNSISKIIGKNIDILPNDLGIMPYLAGGATLSNFAYNLISSDGSGAYNYSNKSLKTGMNFAFGLRFLFKEHFLMGLEYGINYFEASQLSNNVSLNAVIVNNAGVINMNNNGGAGGFGSTAYNSALLIHNFRFMIGLRFG
jgi:hypothetical protein